MGLDIIDAAMAGLGTVLGSVATLFAQKKKDKRDDFGELLKGHNELLNQFKQLYTETKTREDKCEERQRVLEGEMTTLKIQINNLENRSK